MDLIACHAQTHHGPYLSLNEDSYKFDFDNNIFMVLDAFGGSGIGDKGLKIAEDNIGNFFQRITDDPEATQPFFFSPQYTLEANALINAITYTHKIFLKDNKAKKLDERVGVSGVFLVRDDSYLNIINIGTTRAYLLRNGKLELLVGDQCLNSFKSGDSINIPHFALGLMDNLHYNVKSLHVEQNDQVLLMSDGVYSSLSENDIETEFTKGEEGNKIIENLFQLANNKGNKDNQTILILEF